ncbi:hypothetical protein B4U80_13673 [Leptotrombidium deliense]|uniref:Chitin-binding type-2 domain-containing protein n=1 Tax=Leptotrombidium deliense TaxID=299467 RepID=A0A443SMS8_9ACAR|nr:hypothetical protein B4U80_13673 [Leptotrombidium deliense]
MYINHVVYSFYCNDYIPCYAFPHPFFTSPNVVVFNGPLFQFNYCYGQSDGTAYSDSLRNCRTYFRCRFGRSYEVKCPPNSIFDYRVGHCLHISYARCFYRIDSVLFTRQKY